MSDYRTFIVPFDFSEHARAALFAAADLGRRLTADLHLVHVLQIPTYGYSYVDEAAPIGFNTRDLVNSAKENLDGVARSIENVPGRIVTHVVEGSRVASEIVNVAEKLEADLIVMGTHGRTGLAHAFLGSVAERTLRAAPCPVLTLQATEQDEAGE